MSTVEKTQTGPAPSPLLPPPAPRSSATACVVELVLKEGSRARMIPVDSDSNDTYALDVEVDGEVVASGLWEVAGDDPNDDSAEVRLHVRADMRGRGIGAVMFRRLASSAVRSGHRRLVFGPPHDRVAVYHLLRHLGVDIETITSADDESWEIAVDLST